MNPDTVTRAEHLAWCKARALQYVDAGDMGGAFASLTADLRLHPETADHAATELGAMLLFAGHLNTPHAMREWINGVN
jgi:hypothetical protein